jgi:hypothetical protein
MDFRDRPEKLIELLKKRTVEIKFPTVIHWIPVVRPPFIIAINDIGFIRRVYGYDGFAGKAGWPFIKQKLVPEAETPP